ncbi:MAG: hypothetical protein HY913_07825 [Desulfomonile tiedjei]|nr:hypothetical protein [Desulfomonile tiedjei]
MNSRRNPFRLRASEHVESDDDFVRLFAPQVLDIFGHDDQWARPRLIRSTPGEGKTSLLRLMTPGALQAVQVLRKTEDNVKDLFKRLKRLGAVDDNGPRVLGILISCAHSYAALGDLELEAVKHKRFLTTLFNARIVLAFLKAVLSFHGKRKIEELRAIELVPPDPMVQWPGLTFPSNGEILYEWARNQELSVCRELDSFAPFTESNVQGADEFYPLRFLGPDSVNFSGLPLAPHVLLMFDDVHTLTTSQREYLVRTVITARPKIGVWFAERMDAMRFNELVSPGARLGRDYSEPIDLGDYWRNKSGRAFEKFVSNVSDSRVKGSDVVEVSSLVTCLRDSLDGISWDSKFQSCAEEIRNRVEKKREKSQRYSDWMSFQISQEDDLAPRESALEWRKLEILIERRDQNVQPELFDLPIPNDTLEKPLKDSNLAAAAELFLSLEYHVPYYYGLKRIADMASGSIEQFLSIAGALFEEVISSILLKRSPILEPEDQERIVKSEAQQYWDHACSGLRHVREAKNLLESIGNFSRWQSTLPNAPYAPGVTGIGIRMDDVERLQRSIRDSKGDDQRRLAFVISSCVANNILEAKPNVRCKDRDWLVLYLNRLLCVHFGLPLQRGGWRQKSLEELVEWTKEVRTGESLPKGSVS